MIRQNSALFRIATGLSLLGCASMAFSSISMASMLAPPARQSIEEPKFEAIKASRELTASEQKKLTGRGVQNPYWAGSQKWAISIAGVDITTGNFSTAVTDLSFEGGYGIPVNVTRSYSANNADEGPLGPGWTLSVDMRSTAGGLFKKSGSPTRSVPVSFKERPSTQRIAVTQGGLGATDPNEPVEAVIATDAGGFEETMQRDVDGIITPPSWDQSVIETEYEWITMPDGRNFQVAVAQTVTTVEGTVYEYTKHGAYEEYSNSQWQPAMIDFRDSTPTESEFEPSNVLKIDSATDRHGNVTTYTYSTSKAEFQKANGHVREDKLIGISMPGGHTLTFTWGTSGTANRIVSVSDNGSTARTVTYAYTNGYLTSYNTTAGQASNNRVTTYEYGSVGVPTNWPSSLPTGSATVLTSITDPRGLESTMDYVLWPTITPVGYTGVGVYCYRVTDANGFKTQFIFPLVESPYYSGAMLAETRVFSDVNVPVPSLEHHNDPYYNVFFEWGTTSGITTDIPPFFYINGIAASDPGVLGYYAASGFTKTYSASTGNCVYEFSGTQQMPTGISLPPSHQAPEYGGGVSKEIIYNFRGSPLTQIVKEIATGEFPTQWASSPSRTFTTSYAYWGRDKYFQQKAVKDRLGRISFTDYYNDQAATGKKGLTKELYRESLDSSHYNTFDNATTTSWRSDIVPHSGSMVSSSFDYDAKGRPTSVSRLQKIVGGTPSYVVTTTSYNSDGTSLWGNIHEVIEDAGSGKLNRSTATTCYDGAGKATEMTDAEGRHFRKTHNLDGQLVAIELQSGSNWVTKYSCTYGSTQGDIRNGLPISLTDSVQSNMVTLTTEYYDTPAAKRGKLSHIQTATSGSNHAYDVFYDYNDTGDRRLTTYVSTYNNNQQEVTQYEYDQWDSLGQPGQMRRVFHRLTKRSGATLVGGVPSGGSKTSEEFRYRYAMDGTLLEAIFAMSPSQSTVDSSGNWYNGTTHLPLGYARALYQYDQSGRMLNLNYDWYQLQNGSMVPTQVGRYSYTYDHDLGLRTGEKVYNASNALVYEEEYNYDSRSDYLTEATYSDASSWSGSWSYDAAGNRANSGYTYDSLNRMTTSPSTTYTNDLVGNRLTRNRTASGQTEVVNYDWDCFNRLGTVTTTLDSTQTDAYAYNYRPDGLMHRKIRTATYQTSGYDDFNFDDDNPTTLYRYDGQMQYEEEVITSASTGRNDPRRDDVTRNTLGPRGIEMTEAHRVSSNIPGDPLLNNPSRVFPLYDAHGNMIATLKRSGAGSYSIANQKRYDAWGAVRYDDGVGTSDHVINPKTRYCASLGHVEDTGTGLTYMRARWYDNTVGRFISQDPAHAGSNWFVYAKSNPIGLVDFNGRDPLAVNPGDENYFEAMIFAGSVLLLAAGLAAEDWLPMAAPLVIACLAGALELFGLALGCFTNINGPVELFLLGAPVFLGVALGIAKAINKMFKLPAAGAIGVIAGLAMGVYALSCLALLIDISCEAIDFNPGAGG